MALDKLVDSAQLDSDLGDVADAIRAKSGGSSQLAFPSGFVSEIESIQTGGGTAVTDGIVVTARDSEGNPTQIEVYGTIIFPYTAGATVGNSYMYPFSRATNITLKNSITEIKNNAFTQGRVETISQIPTSCSAVGMNAFRQSGLTGITVLGAPTWGNYVFYSCTSLTTVQLGSVGYATKTFTNNQMFYNCTALTNLTIYADGSNVDTLLSQARAGASNASIVIKAANNTTYNGVSYAAGETMVTSTPT